jgi:hypothetical protein
MGQAVGEGLLYALPDTGSGPGTAARDDLDLAMDQVAVAFALEYGAVARGVRKDALGASPPGNGTLDDLADGAGLRHPAPSDFAPNGLCGALNLDIAINVSFFH